MTLLIPENVPTRVITQPCETCNRMGYRDGRTCRDCGGVGKRTIYLLGCPIHKQAVGFDPNGGLLGQCDGCAGEAARGIRAIEEGALV